MVIHNIAELPKAERDKIQAEKMYYWLRHYIRVGSLTVAQAMAKVEALDEPHRSIIKGMINAKTTSLPS